MVDPVVVAGAGPVGLTAALVLARRGVPVLVLEAGAALSAESRASTFHPPTLEMLADLGVYDDLAAAGIVATTFAYRDRQEGLIATLNLEVLHGDTAYPFRIQCEQSKLTPILLSRLRREPNAVVRFNAKVTAVTPRPDGIDVVVGDEPVHASWLIGADGASSAVRKALGLDFDGITYPERFLVVSTDEPLESILGGLAPVNYVFDPEEWMVLLRTPEHWRILLPTPDGTTDEAEVAAERVQARLEGIASLGRPWSLLHASIYRVHQRVASAYRSGRAMVIGDAAHVNNPLGGMGMNSGIHDAVLGAGMLGDLLNGVATKADLDRVLAQRREVALRYVQQSTHRNWEAARERDPVKRARAHDELRRLAADPVASRDYLLGTSMIRSLREVPA